MPTEQGKGHLPSQAALGPAGDGHNVPAVREHATGASKKQ